MTETHPLPLSSPQTKFILHWGEMGARWGINRTVAQVHALLYIWPRPIHAEDIAKTLSVARSNVSNSLRELQTWNIVRIVHVLGDRRDHFETPTDVWALFDAILEERKRREIDPTLALLRECVDEAAAQPTPDPETIRRLQGLLDFFQSMTRWYDHIRGLPRPAMTRFFKLGGKVRKLLGVA